MAAATFEADIVLTISDYHGRSGHATFNNEFTVDGLPDEISTLDVVVLFCCVAGLYVWQEDKSNRGWIATYAKPTAT